MLQRVRAGILRLDYQVAVRVPFLLTACIQNRHDDTSGNLQGAQNTLYDVTVIFKVAPAIRKHLTVRTLGARQFPFSQHVQDLRANWDHAVAGFRFWLADHVPAVDALANMNPAGLEVHIHPSETAQLRTA